VTERQNYRYLKTKDSGKYLKLKGIHSVVNFECDITKFSRVVRVRSEEMKRRMNGWGRANNRKSGNERIKVV
jgi:hypothetical protein